MPEPVPDPAAFRDFEAATWNEGRAEPYDRVFGPVTAQLAAPLLDATRAGPAVRLLDVACGPGYVAGEAAARGAEATGVDVAPQMVELARVLHPGAEFQVGPAEGLPFDDGSFDATVANFLLPHLADVPAVATELRRVLAPGGSMALTTWRSPERTRFIGAVVEAVAAAGATVPADLPPGPSFFQYADPAEMEGLLRDCGLAEVSVETVAVAPRVADLDSLWDDIVAGTVRTSALIARQDPPTQAALHEHFVRILEPYRDSGGFTLPCEVTLGAGRAP